MKTCTYEAISPKDMENMPEEEEEEVEGEECSGSESDGVRRISSS